MLPTLFEPLTLTAICPAAPPTGLPNWSWRATSTSVAVPALPFGTVVTVTDLDNGRSVTVTINDRGPYIAGRIIDLCPTAFSALAPLGQGVAHVEIIW